MKSLNKKASRVFLKLTDGLDKMGDHRTINNSSFMAVHVEVVGEGLKGGLIVSVAHYFSQNGDMCCDPDMTFLMTDDYVFQMTFQQAIPPLYSDAVVIRDGEISIRKKMQSDITKFANQWMANIRSQQF